MLSRLNGWQRLWVLGSGIYFVFVVFSLVTALESTAIQIANDTAELKVLLEEAKRRNDQEVIVLASKKIEILQLPETAFQKKLKVIFKYSLFWLVPIAGVYLFGVAVVWVIDGFRKRASK